MTELTTKIVIVACVGILILWDVYVAFFNDIPNRLDTESGIMARYGHRVSAIPFGWGVLAGHFWSPPPMLPRTWGIFLLLFVAYGLTATHFELLRSWSDKLPRYTSLAYVLVGIPAGALLWAQ